MPPTLVHRTLVFRLGRAGLRPEALENAHAFRSHSPGYGGTTPGGQSASIMSTRAPATGPAARGYVLPIFEWVAEAPTKRAPSASAGLGGRGVSGLAPGFYLRCPPVGAAPRILEWLMLREWSEGGMAVKHGKREKSQAEDRKMLTLHAEIPATIAE